MSRLDFLYRSELPHSAVAVYIYLADPDEREQRVLACHTDHSRRPQVFTVHRSAEVSVTSKSRAY